jgi:hypothetical protein
MARAELPLQDDVLESQVGHDQTAWQPYSSYSTVRAFVILPLLERPLIVLVGQSPSVDLGTQLFPLHGPSFLAIAFISIVD